MLTAHIEDGYNITLTDAPKDLGGRLCRNCARTTPEFPVSSPSVLNTVGIIAVE